MFSFKKAYFALLIPLLLILVYYNAYPYYAGPPYSTRELYSSRQVLMVLQVGVGLTALFYAVTPYLYTYLSSAEILRVRGFRVRRLFVALFFLVTALPALIHLTLGLYSGFVLAPSGYVMSIYYTYATIMIVVDIVIYFAPILFLLLVFRLGFNYSFPLRKYITYWLVTVLLIEIVNVLAQIAIDLLIAGVTSPLHQAVYLREWNEEVKKIILSDFSKNPKVITNYTLIPSWGAVITYLITRPLTLNYVTNKHILK
ncbi:MAG: hypothetical protein QXY67_04760 [Zestosphaera sp.]